MSPATALSTVVSAVGLVVIFGRPLLARFRGGPPNDPDWPDIRRLLARSWTVLIGVALAVTVVDGPAALGLGAPSVGSLVDGFLYGFIAFAGTMILVALALRYAGGVAADRGSLVVFDQPVSRRLAVATTGAVTESVLYFGFAIEALLGFGTGPWVAGAAAVAGVLLSRGRWSSKNALQWLPGAIVLAAVAFATRTVVVVVLVRLAYDALTLASGDADDYEVATDA